MYGHIKILSRIAFRKKQLTIINLQDAQFWKNNSFTHTANHFEP